MRIEYRLWHTFIPFDRWDVCRAKYYGRSDKTCAEWLHILGHRVLLSVLGVWSFMLRAEGASKMFCQRPAGCPCENNMWLVGRGDGGCVEIQHYLSRVTIQLKLASRTRSFDLITLL